MKKLFIALIFALLCFIPGKFFAATETKDYYFSSFNVNLIVNENSAVMVEEYETLSFQGSFSYITREIPYQGEMQIENIQVFDETDKHQLFGKEIEISDTGYSKQITLHFNVENAEKTWLIKYKVKNIINSFSDYNELYWNVLPDDRTVAVDKVKATVILPKAVSDTSLFQQTIYSGDYGSTDQLTTYHVADNKTLVFDGINIGAYQNFTIVAGWPLGIVSMPAKYTISANKTADIIVDNKITGWQTPYSFWIGSDEIMTPGEHEVTLQKFGFHDVVRKINVQADTNGAWQGELVETLWYIILKIIIYILLGLYIASPLMIFIWLLLKWFKTGRDPKGRGTIIPQYEPYQNDPPGLMGTLMDEKADLIDITSSLVDLAVRGYIKIIEKEEKKYTLKKLKNSDAKLLTYETSLLLYIFADKQEIAMADLSQKFYIHIKTIRDQMYEQLLQKKYFERNPNKIRNKYYAWAAACLIFGAAGIFVFFLGIPLLLIGIILLIFAGRMPKRTPQGVEAKEWALGFKMFLFHAERYRIAKMTPEYFERCLPYAMVFKVENEWAKHFANIYKQPPSWYQGPATNNLAAWSLIGFTSSLSHSFAPILKTTLTSMPRSSGAAGGHSGFGGGGFSGGGFGGGGFRAG